MIKYLRLNKTLFAAAMLCASWAFAQEKPLSWYTENLPKENVVKLLDETTIVIERDEKNNLRIYRKLNEEKLLITTRAGAFSERQIVFSSFFNVRDVEATTYLPKGNNKFKKEKVKEFRTEKLMSDRVFHDDLEAVKFSYPDLKMGAKIGLSYTEDILNPFFVPPVYFQDSYFAEKIRVSLQAPDDVKIKINKFHMDDAKIAHSSSTTKGITTHVWEVDSVPQFSGEGGAPAPSYFVPHISFIVEGYDDHGTEIPVLTGVADLYKWYSGMLDSVSHELSPEMKSVVDSIVQKNEGELKQAQALFDWVRSSIKYIAVEDGLGGFIPDNPAAVTRKRFGDCKGMSCLLATLMREAGLNARECWIGTRDIPYKYTENYTPFVDNHMITAFNHAGTWYFLDPTDGYVPFGYPSSFIQGKEALIGLGNGKFVLETVPEMTPMQTLIHVADTIRIHELNLKSKSKMVLSGYDATRFKRLYKNTDDQKRFFKYYLETGNDKFEMYDLPTVVIKDTTIELTYQYTLPDYLRSFDDKFFLNLNMDRIFSDVTFEDRKLPLERDFKHAYQYTHYVEVPKGYKVSFLPENYAFTADFADVKMDYLQQENYVKYTMLIEVKQLLMPASDTESWNDMVKELRKNYRKNIELVKLN